MLIALFVCVSVIIAPVITERAGCGDGWFQESDPKIIAANFTGTVASPNFHDTGTYPADLQCIYTFVADPRRRVRLQFEEFILDSSAPRCGDYLDIYSELREPNLDILTQQHSGRYCGSVSPRTRISLHQVIVLVFHVRKKSHGGKGFSVIYDFIDEDQYLVYGAARPLVNAECGFLLHGTSGQTYSIYSPTYPGKYPANAVCKYLLEGERGSRIKLSLKDFDLFFGGQHCPYDALTVYDGDSNTAPVITRLCGLQQLVDVFSQGPNLYMEFFTISSPFAEHRGFHIEATFDKGFVDLNDFIGGDPDIKHISGTECDIQLTSAGESEHFIHSPGFPQPYPPKTVCTYYLDGRQGARSLEKVYLTIRNFSISSQTADNATAVSVTDEGSSKCPLSNVTIDRSMLDDKMESSSAGDNDIGLCGDQPSIRMIDSEGPRMTVTFYASPDEARRLTNIGFEARVKFSTDFGIRVGNHSGKSNDCNFSYTSSGVQKVEYFNSPRYPENYALNVTCTYYFNGRPGEIIRFNFDEFVLSQGPEKSFSSWHA